MQTIRLLLASLVCGAMLVGPRAARGAESYDNCTGFIDTLPATISTQGTWCLRKDLSTGITSGSAITIATNNVTVDCNHFKIGGLAAGNSSGTYGISTFGKLNATIRHCNVRGFFYGAYLSGSGHSVEDNRFDQNLYIGVYVVGENNMVRRNAVLDTGGYPFSNFSYGIYAGADIIENTVSGVFTTEAEAYPRGIYAIQTGSDIRGNRVRGLAVPGAGSAIGIWAVGSGSRMDANHVSAASVTAGWGIVGAGSVSAFCTDNTVAKYTAAIQNCQDAGGNASH